MKKETSILIASDSYLLLGSAKEDTNPSISELSSPLVMYHFVAEFLAPVVSYLMTDEAGCDCTV